MEGNIQQTVCKDVLQVRIVVNLANKSVFCLEKDEITGYIHRNDL